jgi:hypothetical protein
MMEFRMSEIPLSDVKVAEAVVRCLQKCDRAFNVALVETKEMMPESDWNVLRRGVGHIMAGGMYDLWLAVVKRHPQFAAFGDETAATDGQ